jgi:hypothetical protein
MCFAFRKENHLHILINNACVVECVGFLHWPIGTDLSGVMVA